MYYLITKLQGIHLNNLLADRTGNAENLLI